MSQLTGADNVLDMKSVPTALIVNTKARKGRDLFVQAKTTLSGYGIKLAECYPLNHSHRLPQVMQNLVERGVKAIILGSGDGTISSAVDFLVNHNVTLGVLPLGTANDFARTLSLPDALEEACRVIAAGHTAKVDLGRVNGNYYVNVASVGFGAEVVEYTSDKTKKWLGPLAYPLAAARAAFNRRPFTAQLVLPDRTIETKAIHIAVANGRFYGGGVVVAPDARIDDNELVITVFEPMNPVELSQVGIGLRDGSYVRHPKVQIFRNVQELKLDIMHGGRKRINVDGELAGHTPAQFGIASRALKVFVPKD